MGDPSAEAAANEAHWHGLNWWGPSHRSSTTAIRTRGRGSPNASASATPCNFARTEAKSDNLGASGAGWLRADTCEDDEPAVN
jgi:hypothetical protein